MTDHRLFRVDEAGAVGGYIATKADVIVGRSGGVMPYAPLYPVFDYFAAPWKFADRHCWLSMDEGGQRTRAWLFPRWHRITLARAEARRRCAHAWRTLRHGIPETDHWSDW